MTQTKEEHYEYAIQIHTTSLWLPSRQCAEKLLAKAKKVVGDSGVGVALVRRVVGEPKVIE